MTGRNSYVTRPEAIEREIILPIELNGLSVDDYDVQGIADQTIGDYDEGYACMVDEEEFWEIVKDNAF